MAIERDPNYKSALDSRPIERDPNTPREYLGSIADEDVPLGDPIENLRNAKLGYGVVLQKWRGREKEVDADRMRSDEGKLVTKQKELPEFEKQHLANLDTVVEGWVKRVEKLEADYTDVKQFTDADSAGAVRSAEIRSWFSKLDRATQIAKLHDAVRNNDTELTSAAISAPASMQLIAPEIRAHLIEAMIEKKYPNMVAEIARIRRVVGAAQFAAKRVRELMQPRGNRPDDIRARLIVGTDGSK